MRAAFSAEILSPHFFDAKQDFFVKTNLQNDELRVCVCMLGRFGRTKHVLNTF